MSPVGETQMHEVAVVDGRPRSTSSGATTLDIPELPKEIHKRDFGILPIPKSLRVSPTNPPHFNLLLNVLFGFGSTFGELDSPVFRPAALTASLLERVHRLLHCNLTRFPHLVVSNLYYCQPLLSKYSSFARYTCRSSLPLLVQLSHTFNVSYDEVSRIPTLVQAGSVDITEALRDIYDSPDTPLACF